MGLFELLRQVGGLLVTQRGVHGLPIAHTFVTGPHPRRWVLRPFVGIACFQIVVVGGSGSGSGGGGAGTAARVGRIVLKCFKRFNALQSRLFLDSFFIGGKGSSSMTKERILNSGIVQQSGVQQHAMFLVGFFSAVAVFLLLLLVLCFH